MLKPQMTESTVRQTGYQDLGYLAGGKLILLRTMGDKAPEVQRLFLKQSEARGIPNTSYTSGRLAVREVGVPHSLANQARDYLFVERDFGHGAKATMAVRVAPIGTDLYVDWRYYVLPPRGYVNWLVFLGLCFVFWWTLFIVPVLYLIIGAIWGRADDLIGFQRQDGEAFQLAIRAAIEEAIDLAAIDKALRMDSEYGSELAERKRFRVI
jgi:hypothetical protein